VFEAWFFRIDGSRDFQNTMSRSPLDIAFLVPFEPLAGDWVDPKSREILAAQAPFVRARHRVEELLGVFPEGIAPRAHRSLTAITLATSLARAHLSFRALDPGVAPLSAWRTWIERLAADRPRVVGISSTFVTDGYWIATLCALVRRILPESRLVVGGYYYAENAEEFLSLDADVLCIGEGERRIVQIVEATRDGAKLDGIPGLYLREHGHLRYTGDPEPLSLDEQPLPDWSLASRIEPSVDLERDALEHCAETQRGCIFKCEYCTFRTLAAPIEGSVDRGVRAILDAARGRGDVFVVDATLTSPRERFVRLLEALVAKGGSPLPIGAFARVSDLDDEVCGLMARAGFRHVRIGQESGDQRMLNAMKKGTRLDQVAPAIASLGKHGLAAFMFFIFGFPGETRESLAATRRLARSINDGHESAPVVLGIAHAVFRSQALAGIRQRGVLSGPHRYGYEHLEVTPSQAMEAGVHTFLEVSRVAHAPVDHTVSGPIWGLYDSHERVGADRLAFFRWGKAVDRAIALFLEEDLEGKPLDGRELARLRERILAGISTQARRHGALGRLRMRFVHRAKWRALDNWARCEGTPGVLTRTALAWEAGNSVGQFQAAYEAFRRGEYPRLGYASTAGTIDESTAANHLIELGVSTGRRRLAKAR
jgi:anaerobic magnesium-protoporphyrin IX monomethyl ester cyclase